MSGIIRKANCFWKRPLSLAHMSKLFTSILKWPEYLPFHLANEFSRFNHLVESYDALNLGTLPILPKSSLLLSGSSSCLIRKECEGHWRCKISEGRGLTTSGSLVYKSRTSYVNARDDAFILSEARGATQYAQDMDGGLTLAPLGSG